MAAPLGVQCYREGFSRVILSLTKSSHLTKQATGMAPLAERELALLGEKTFRGSFGQPDVLSAFKNILMPRYGQVAAAHALRNNYMENILRLSKQMKSVGRANPAYGGLARQVSDATSAFRPAQQRLFTEIGSAVKPRQDFLQKTLPMATGLGAGGAAGFVGGEMKGEGDERDQIQQGLTQVPLMTRLKYLFDPSGTFKSAALMGGLGGGMRGIGEGMFKSMPRMMGSGLAHSSVSGFGRQMPKMMGQGMKGLGSMGSKVTQPGMFPAWKNTAIQGMGNPMSQLKTPLSGNMPMNGILR